MKRTDGSFLCFAHGDASGWEAICIDFDIAVQGDSLDAVKASLTIAINSFVNDLQREDETTRAALLNRRAPFWVTLGLTMKLIAFNVFRRPNRQAQASFPVTCPV